MISINLIYKAIRRLQWIIAVILAPRMMLLSAVSEYHKDKKIILGELYMFLYNGSASPKWLNISIQKVNQISRLRPIDYP